MIAIYYKSGRVLMSAVCTLDIDSNMFYLYHEKDTVRSGYLGEISRIEVNDKIVYKNEQTEGKN